jgi:hypothetical protein
MENLPASFDLPGNAKRAKLFSTAASRAHVIGNKFEIKTQVHSDKPRIARTST